MNKTEDISRLDKAIKDAETRIRTVLVNVESYTKEIDFLSNQEKTLEENVKCLKKNRIIAIAQEFKKAKAELAKVRARMQLLSNDRDHFRKQADDMKEFIKKTQKELDKIQNISDNNVLQFNRSGKDGQG